MSNKTEIEVIEGITQAWVSFSDGANEYLDRIRKSRGTEAESESVSALAFSSADMDEHGWVLAGRATVRIELLSREATTLGQVSALKAQIKKTRAEAGQKVEELEEEIQKLLCLPHFPEGGMD